MSSLFFSVLFDFAFTSPPHNLVNVYGLTIEATPYELPSFNIVFFIFSPLDVFDI
jgi:hypothetical protein